MKAFIALLFLCITSLSLAQKQGSPYLHIATSKAEIPLKSSKTAIQIAGTIAHVSLTQVYQNQGATPIAATYVFPLSTEAAVHDMQMTIGTRIVNAKIFEKQEAQRIYKTAISQGKRAAKLDQERPNIFQMNVGNIMPNESISITVHYTEMLRSDKGSYQFVVPAVVGPRFTGESQTDTKAFHTPYMSKGCPAPFVYDLTCSINAGMIIKDISSKSHHINVNYTNTNTAEVFLSKSNTNPGNRDFILNINLRDSRVQSGLLLYEHEDENFFALQMEPKAHIKSEDIPGREYLFIVDVSGSMNGYPLEVSKTLMRNLLCNLNATDTFNVQLFASSATALSPYPLEVNTTNIDTAIRFLSDGQGGGGTQLLNALEKAYALPRKDPSSARSMVVITDGYVSVEKEAFHMIKTHLDQANVFTFGIGSSVNRYLIEGLAKVSQSKAFIATSKAEAHTVAEAFKNYIETPLVTQLQLKTKSFEVYDVTPSSIPDVFASRPVLIYGKYRGKPQGRITLTGYHGKKRFKQEFTVTPHHVSSKHKALRYLWARKKIAQLDDYNTLFSDNTKSEVTALGLSYNLATAYTSFVAVDNTIAHKNGTPHTTHQPLPMPHHVSNSAVGASAEVSSQLKFKTSFSISMPKHIAQHTKRSIQMEFRTLYTTLVSNYLKQYESIRLTFNTKGQITAVAILNNGQWTHAPKLVETFSKVKTAPIALCKAMTLTLKR